MAKNNNLTDFVRDLAGGFREKLGWDSTDKINPQDFRDFVEHSPSVGTLTIGLEALNWTRTLNEYIYIECPSSIEKSMYYNVDTGTPLLPLIQFRIVALDPIAAEDSIIINDDSTSGYIGTLTATKKEIRYILPVFANTDPNSSEITPKFPSFSMTPDLSNSGDVRVQMTATWVQIGSTQYPMRLSGATMGGIK